MKKHATLPEIQQNRGPGWWAERAAEARTDPDSWFEVPGEFHRSMVSYLRAGKSAGFDPAEFEVTSRKGEGGLSRIFIKVKG